MPRAVVSRRPHARRLRRAALLACGIAILTTAVTGIAVTWLLHAGTPPELPPRIPAHHSFVQHRPVLVTLTREWKKHSVQAPIDEVTSSLRLWLDMHFDDWDRLPIEIRRRGLMRMRARFDETVAGPMTWSAMDARDWDAVPQPIRMVVFPMMVAHWVNEYAIGSAFHLPRQLIVDTISAIVMAESWFQHRADVENAWGNRDIGLGQCSNKCRRDLAKMADEGVLEFLFTEEDYLNPWNATRAAVIWFGLELARAEGDLDLAIRAYNRGFEAASKGEGTEYLNNVRRLRHKYFGPQPDRSPTWGVLAMWASQQVADTTAASRDVLAAATREAEDRSLATSARAALSDDVSRVAHQVAATANPETGPDSHAGRSRRDPRDGTDASR